MQRVSQDQMIVDNIRKNIVPVKSVKGDLVYTRDDYQAFISHFVTLIKELDFDNIYNISSFGANIEGTKNVRFEDIELNESSNLACIDTIAPFKIEIKGFIDEEFKSINEIISKLSKGDFSPALATSVIKSVLVYQYMQAEILNVLQKNFSQDLAESFISTTKTTIKTVVELLQKNKLI